MYLLELYKEMSNDDNLDERDKTVVGVLPLLAKYATRYTSILKTKDEMFDIQQDLLLYAYKCVETYNSDKKSKFSTYLMTRLLDFNKDFCQKYYGIKATRWDYKKHKKDYCEDLKFYFEPYDSEEDWDG